MPTYSFRCLHCETEQDLFCRVSELETSTPYCCGEKATQVFTHAPYGYVQTECHYRCPVTGKGVTNWRQRRNIFAERNLVDGSDWNPEKEIARAKKRQAEQLAIAAGMPAKDNHPELIFGETNV